MLLWCVCIRKSLPLCWIDGVMNGRFTVSTVLFLLYGVNCTVLTWLSCSLSGCFVDIFLVVEVPISVLVFLGGPYRNPYLC